MKANTVRQVMREESDVFTFGKYRDATVGYVLRKDAQYILWLDEQEIVDFSEEIVEDAENIVAELDDRADIWSNGVDGWGSLE